MVNNYFDKGEKKQLIFIEVIFSFYYLSGQKTRQSRCQNNPRLPIVLLIQVIDGFQIHPSRLRL